jgi:putative endonuclease
VSWFVYVARCADRTLYCGIAVDVTARIAAHDAGKGARYTRGRGPLEVMVTRRCRTQGDALRLEYAFKQLTRDGKERLVAEVQAGSRRRLDALARAALRG